jgi:hypothetical protein
MGKRWTRKDQMIAAVGSKPKAAKAPVAEPAKTVEKKTKKEDE